MKKIRVVALDFMATDIGRKHGPSAISDLAAWDVKVVLGEAPVYEDGSAAFEVPARTPVYFQRVYQKRLDWQKQEAANIQAYVDAQNDTPLAGERH